MHKSTAILREFDKVIAWFPETYRNSICYL